MAWIALQGGEIGQVPTFESLLSNQIATALAAKVQALMGAHIVPTAGTSTVGAIAL
jgi:hypothetical protein